MKNLGHHGMFGKMVSIIGAYVNPKRDEIWGKSHAPNLTTFVLDQSETDEQYCGWLNFRMVTISLEGSIHEFPRIIYLYMSYEGKYYGNEFLS